MNFTTRLREIQCRQNSLVCVGLDTDSRKIPPSLSGHADRVVEFNTQIIAATKDLVCAYKLNLAFYEAMGRDGWTYLHRTLEQIPDTVITIGDAKRGDIGNSSGLYAQALLDDFRFTATTVNPYMGGDSVEPFLKREDRGAFILTVTSNPGAKDLQYLRVNGKPLYEHVIRKVKSWNTCNNCGLVVGATKPRELQRIRKLAPTMPLLIPGIGAQGGDLALAVRHGCDRYGELAVINASRSVLYASAQEDFATAARRAAERLRDEINGYRVQYFSSLSRTSS
jgi:orotidine-5'-phosphate decarboxylase